VKFVVIFSISHRFEPRSGLDGYQMYFEGSAVGKGSQIGIEISPTFP